MDPAELRSALADLNTVMQIDLLALWRAIDGQDVEVLRTVLQAEVPDVVDPYLSAAGDITADWYEAQAPRLAYTATPAPLPPRERLETTARWAAGSVLSRSSVSPLDLLSGSMQRALFDESRRTVLDNAQAERGARWARHASANACEFCRMVATRGAVYASEASATRVGGRGVDVSTNVGRRRGRRAGGRRSRGSQAIGSRYHDHCRCIAVPVRPGTSYEPPSYVEEWEAEYTRARKAADGVDAKSILSAWRKLQPE